MLISLIVAVAKNGVIGNNNDLVWKLRDDMQFFASTTRGHAIITGRKNYESIPERFRPLKDRTNIVVTRNLAYAAPGAVVVHSLEAALEVAAASGEEEVFIIGGGQIYAECLKSGRVDRQYVTHVDAEPKGDTFFPLEGLDSWRVETLMQQESNDRNEHAFVVSRYDRL
ncbi:MAG: dihydrofolate reductase [Flavobacteriales bacterium]|jgi:dihydrofolate reductase